VGDKVAAKEFELFPWLQQHDRAGIHCLLPRAEFAEKLSLFGADFKC